MLGEECTATVDAAFGKTPSSFTKGSSLSKVWRFTVLDKMSKSCISWCHLHLKTCFFWIQSFVFFLTARKRVSQRHSCTKKHAKTLKLSVFWCFCSLYIASPGREKRLFSGRHLPSSFCLKRNQTFVSRLIYSKLMQM